MIDLSIVEKISQHVKKGRSGEYSIIEGKQFVTHALDDLTITFSSKGSFEGLFFEVLYRNFIILPDSTILMEDVEGKQEPVIVRDSVMVQRLNEFLTWRLAVLQTVGDANASIPRH